MSAPPAARRSSPGAPFTVAELAARFGSLPAGRIHSSPAPGTATREDAEAAREAGFLCEWVENTLIDKALSELTSFVAARIIGLLNPLVHDGELGWVLAPDGFVDLYGGTLQRAPDVSVVLNEQRPNGLAGRGYSEGAPALCVEVYSTSNTRPEMERKRTEYFENGCRLCWTVFPATDRRPATVEVHTPESGPGDDAGTVLTDADELSAAPVLSDFAVPVASLFRRGA